MQRPVTKSLHANKIYNPGVTGDNLNFHLPTIEEEVKKGYKGEATTTFPCLLVLDISTHSYIVNVVRALWCNHRCDLR